MQSRDLYFFYKTRKRLWLMLFCVCSSSSSFAGTIVFTDSAHPMQNVGDSKVVLLDAPQALEGELSADLPADPDRAAELVKQRMTGVEGQQFNQRMRIAQQGVTDAWSLHLEKVPAVVVDRSYVVYGISDVSQAEALISRSRQGGDQ